MTEKEIRSKVVEIAKGWLGCKESDGSHKKIIDTYNACKPLPRNRGNLWIYLNLYMIVKM